MHQPRDVVPDPSAATVRVNEHHAPVGNGSDWLGDALGQMTGQIHRRLMEVEQRHADAMRDMQAKLERMSDEASRARPNLPPDLAAAFGRIQDGMTDLVTKIAHAKSEPAPADRFVFSPKSDAAVDFVFDPVPAQPVAPPRQARPIPKAVGMTKPPKP